MGSAFGDLNGSGNQQIWANVARTSQNQGGNYSTFYGEIRYYGNGWGSYTGSNQYWSGSAPNLSVSGSWTIPYANRNDTYTVLWAGYWNIGHDAAGNLGPFNLTASIDSDHTSIGDGSVNAPEGASPRIPKRPSPPGTPTFSELGPNSVRVSWTASADNAGSAIDSYLLRYWPNAAGTGPYTDHSSQNNLSRVVSGLTPGQSYRFRVYAHNGSADNGGYSNPSGDAVVTTLAGIYVGNGTEWVAAGLKTGNGSAWESPYPQIGDGDSWEDPINV